jgi:hypothetical protein
MSKCLWVAVILVLMASAVDAQTIFQSSDGESSLALRDGGLIHVNFGDGSVSFGLVRQVSTDRWQAGFDGKLKAKDGFVSLVKDGFALREGALSGFAGRQFLPDVSVVQYQFVGGRFRYVRGSFDVLPENSATLEPATTKFNGVTAGVFYNAFFDTAKGDGGGQEFLFGLAVDYGRRHNVDMLEEVEVCEETHSLTTATGTVRRVSDCTDASLGTYQTSNKFTASVDLLWYQSWSSNRLAFAFLGRYDDMKNDTPFVPGVGLFITESGSPLKMQGGVTFEIVDDKPRLGIQVGFPF